MVLLHIFVNVWNWAEIHVRMVAAVERIDSWDIKLLREWSDSMLMLLMFPWILGSLPVLVVTRFAFADATLVLGLVSRAGPNSTDGTLVGSGLG